jgi:hypothetical protein
LQPGFCFLRQQSEMRDMKDKATFDLPGFEESVALPSTPTIQPKRSSPRERKAVPKHEQLELLEQTDATGLPVWHRDDKLDLTGLPVWAPT